MFKVKCDCGEGATKYTRDRAVAWSRDHADRHHARALETIRESRSCPFRLDKELGACNCHAESGLSPRLTTLTEPI